MARQPTEEELAQREEEVKWEALRNGEAVQRIVEDQEVFAERIATLKEVHPHIATDDAIAALSSPLKQIEDEYGPETATSPVIIARVYEELGGEERFAPDPEVEDWNRAVYRPTGSVFTR
jgi:hypothetical protein